MPTKINQDQIKSLIRAAFIAAGSVAVKHGLIAGSAWQDILGTAAVIGPIIWSIFEKREGAKLDKAITVVNDALASGDAAHVVIPGEAPAVAKTTS